MRLYERVNFGEINGMHVNSRATNFEVLTDFYCNNFSNASALPVE